jgi:hypothetical protein
MSSSSLSQPGGAEHNQAPKRAAITPFYQSPAA